jgi:hypothetical protein
MIATIEVEVLPDDEYALWEQAVTSAEQQRVDRSLSRALQPEALAQQYPGAPDQPNEAVDQAVASVVENSLPDLEDFGAKVNRRAKYRPGGLRVTDITSAEWCQQQVAFTLSARLPKVSSLFAVVLLVDSYLTSVNQQRCWLFQEVTETEAMAAGTAVHAALEAELSMVYDCCGKKVQFGTCLQSPLCIVVTGSRGGSQHCGGWMGSTPCGYDGRLASTASGRGHPGDVHLGQCTGEIFPTVSQ